MAMQQAYVLECTCTNLHRDRWQQPYNSFWVLTYRSFERPNKWKFTFKKSIKLWKGDKHFVEPIRCQDRKSASVASREAPEVEYATYDVSKRDFGHFSKEPAAYVLQHLAVWHLVSASWYKAPRLWCVRSLMEKVKCLWSPALKPLCGAVSCFIASQEEIRSLEVWLNFPCPRVTALFWVHVWQRWFFFLATQNLSPLEYLQNSQDRWDASQVVK